MFVWKRTIICCSIVVVLFLSFLIWTLLSEIKNLNWTELNYLPVGRTGRRFPWTSPRWPDRKDIPTSQASHGDNTLLELLCWHNQNYGTTNQIIWSDFSLPKFGWRNKTLQLNAFSCGNKNSTTTIFCWVNKIMQPNRFVSTTKYWSEITKHILLLQLNLLFRGVSAVWLWWPHVCLSQINYTSTQLGWFNSIFVPYMTLAVATIIKIVGIYWTHRIADVTVCYVAPRSTE